MDRLKSAEARAEYGEKTVQKLNLRLVSYQENRYSMREYIMGEICRQFRLLQRSLFIGQLVNHPVGVMGM